MNQWCLLTYKIMDTIKKRTQNGIKLDRRKKIEKADEGQNSKL